MRLFPQILFLVLQLYLQLSNLLLQFRYLVGIVPLEIIFSLIFIGSQFLFFLNDLLLLIDQLFLFVLLQSGQLIPQVLL